MGHQSYRTLKIATKISGKKENNDDKKLNPVQYSRKPSVIKRKPTLYQISKLVSGGVIIIEELSPRARPITSSNLCTYHQSGADGTIWARTKHARTKKNDLNENQNSIKQVHWLVRSYNEYNADRFDKEKVIKKR